MALKIYLFVLLIAFVSLTDSMKSYFNEADLFYPGTAPPCDIPLCSSPCEGAARPRKCPTNGTRCASGCACITYCDALGTHTCFETQYCERTRFQPRRRKTTRSVRAARS